jgi:5-methylcytosine-specific restriction protein A
MATGRIDAEALARAAVGRTLYTLDKNLPNTVLEVTGGAVLVRTAETADPAGARVQLALIQRAADQLTREGQLRLDPRTLGHRRTSFIGALLATDPAVAPLIKPMRLRLRSTGDLSSVISRVLALIPEPRQTPTARRGEPLFDLVTGPLRDEVALLVGDEVSYRTKGSAGAGNWADTPWVAVFDLSVTDTATRGHYLVYLFRADGAAVHLSLNQGTTAVFNTERRRYQDTLEARAREYVSLLGLGDRDGLRLGPVDLGGGRPPLTPGYEAGNVAAITYEAGNIPDDRGLANDLRRMLSLYSRLTERIDRIAEGTERGEGPGAQLEENRRLRWHKRYEGRNTRAAKEAKREQGYQCQGCGRDYAAMYGEIGKRCVDAHHKVPFARLNEGRRLLNPRRDFAILCAPCHRIAHSRRTEPLTLSELRAIVAPDGVAAPG